MSNSIAFAFENIAGQPATLVINKRENFVVVTWGGVFVNKILGYRLFLKNFKCTAKGAAFDAALRKYVRLQIEREIYNQLSGLRWELSSWSGNAS